MDRATLLVVLLALARPSVVVGLGVEYGEQTFYKDLRILSGIRDMALTRLTFDDDVYVNSPLVCPRSEQACPTPACIPCDWTTGGAGLCGATCCGPRESDDFLRRDAADDWCDGNIDYTTVGLDEERTFEDIGEGSLRYYRFFVPPSLACQAIQVESPTEFGTVSVFVSNTFARPDFDRADWSSNTRYLGFGQASALICPQVAAAHTTVTPGTYAIAVRAETHARYQLRVRVSGDTMPLQAPTGAATCGGIGTVPGTVQTDPALCLENSETAEITFGSDERLHYIQLYLPLAADCHDVSLTVAGTTTGANADLFCLAVSGAADTVRVTRENALVSRWLDGPDQIGLPVCLAEPGYLRCAVQGTRPGSMAIMFTTTATLLRHRIDTLSSGPLAMSAGLGGVQVVNQGDTRRYVPCADYHVSCNTWLVKAATLPIMFYPPPAGVGYTGLLPVTPYETFIANNLSVPGGSRELVFASVLRINEQRFFASDNDYLANAIVYFPTLSDSTGIPVDAVLSRRTLPANYGSIPTSSFSTSVSFGERCNYESFKDIDTLVRNDIEQLIRSALFFQVFPLRYRVDTLLATEPIMLCQEWLKGSILREEQQVTQVNSTACVWDELDNPVEYLNDPCCNTALQATQCCVPFDFAQIQNVYLEPDDEALLVCNNLDCTKSFVTDYGNSNNIRDGSSQCSAQIEGVASLVLSDNFAVALSLGLNDTTTLCRNQLGFGDNFQGVPCRSDEDCVAFTGVCNMQSRVCRIPQNSLALYLQCFLDESNELIVGVVNELLPLPPEIEFIDQFDPIYRASVTAVASVTDCINPHNVLDLGKASRYLWGAGAEECKAAILGYSYPEDLDLVERDCPPQPCLGNTCLMSSAQCYKQCNPTFEAVPSSAADCPADLHCNIMNIGSCSGFHCAYCRYDTDECFAHPTAGTEGECAAARACELPDGSIAFDSNCDASPTCDVNCPGQSCASYLDLAGVCSTPAANSNECDEVETTTGEVSYYAENSLCVLPLVRSSSKCVEVSMVTGVSTTWFSCGDIDLASCDGSTASQRYLQCFVDEYERCSVAECTSSGECTDRRWARHRTSAGITPLLVEYGACFSSGYFDNTVGETLCHAENMARPGIGCLELDVTSNGACVREEVNEFGEYWLRTWLTPATNSAQCLADVPGRRGCQGVGELFLSWKNRTFCECTIGSQVADAWKWRDGRLVGPQARPLQWMEAQQVLTYNYTSSISVDRLEGLAEASWDFAFTVAAISDVLCETNTILTSLEAITCSCATDGTKDATCFDIQSNFNEQNDPDDISALAARFGACPNLETIVPTPSSILTVSRTSLRTTCSFLNASVVESSWFENSVSTATVSFQFQEKRAPAAVRNEKGASVGVLIGDGTYISFRQAFAFVEFEACLRIQDTEQADRLREGYPVVDVGYTTLDYDFVRPLGIGDTVYEKLIGEALFHCFPMNSTTTPVRNGTIDPVENPNANYAIVFPILTIPGALTAEDQYLDDSTEALVYTLGALFIVDMLLLLVFLFNMGREMYLRKGNVPAVAYLAFLLLMVCVFRIIFMFVYPSGRLDDKPAAEFALFEVSTFLLFTTVIICIKFWNELANRKAFFTRSSWYTFFLYLGILLLVWIAFAVVIIIYSEVILDEDTSTACLGRVPASTDEQDEDTRTLAIVYQSLIIFFTFILACIFAFTSYRLFNLSKNISRAKMFIFRLGSIIVTAFFVRCILFIIILAADFTSAVYLFLTIFFTEVCMIFFCQLLFNWKYIVTIFTGKAPSTTTTQSRASRTNTGVGGDSALHSVMDN